MQKEDALQLTIGYHQLEGKLVLLKKPLAVMEREELPDQPESIQYKVGLAVAIWNTHTQ